MSAGRQERADVLAAREEMTERAATQRHDVVWRLGPNATRRGYAYTWHGECRHCGARVTVGSAWSSCDGVRDVRTERCSGPGTAILTEIETTRVHELIADAVATFGAEVADNAYRGW